MHVGAGTNRPSLAMIMPMAGRGSRFARDGRATPKPLINLKGRPFFWWASESLRRSAEVDEMVFVVLGRALSRPCDRSAHSRLLSPGQDRRAARSDQRRGRDRGARRKGARKRGAHSGQRLRPRLRRPRSGGRIRRAGRADLLSLGQSGLFLRAPRRRRRGRGLGRKAGRQPVRNRRLLPLRQRRPHARALRRLRRDCPYHELFVSGLYNLIAARGGRISRLDARRHVSFGTPEEFDRLDPALFESEFDWT